MASQPIDPSNLGLLGLPLVKRNQLFLGTVLKMFPRLSCSIFQFISRQQRNMLSLLLITVHSRIRHFSHDMVPLSFDLL
jgi:hypothetical protein